jgi:phosphoethanolamine N-methyltransferase
MFIQNIGVDLGGTMSGSSDGELYPRNLIGMLEAVWGEGWLSPGGPEEVERIIAGIDVAGKLVLDVGCGVGGIDFLLLDRHRAGHITGIDVEDTVLDVARERARTRRLNGRARFVKVAPGSLPFAAGHFDVVFSKDAIVHESDKHTLMAEIARILKPGGWFAASDWLIGHDEEPSPEMAAYIAAEGLNFGMASPSRYRDAMEKAGFEEIQIESRNAWYRKVAREELARLKGPLHAEAVSKLGQAFVDHNIEIWTKMLVVLDRGEHCPTHLRGRKPTSLDP